MLIENFLEVSQAPNLITFQARLIGMAKMLGFDLVTGGLVTESPTSKGSATYSEVSNMPQAFALAAHDPAALSRDPVLKRMKELWVPFHYDQALYVREGAADLWEEQAAYGYKTGIAVALHLPGHQHFLLGVDRADPLPDGPILTRLMADLQFLAVHAQSAAVRLLGPPKAALPPPPKLTKKEIEFLKWTQAGKTAWEAGQIMGLTDQGVQYHCRSVLKKLDVTNKHLAVLKAIELGLL